MQIKEDAPVVNRDSIVVAAPLETVWAVLTDIDAWPTWQPEISRAKLNGPLAPGSRFRWGSNGLPITSTIREVEPPMRIAWSGNSLGIDAAHVWTMMQQGDRVSVRVEESFDGWPVRLLRGLMQRALDRANRAWLESLKGRAERIALGPRG